MSARFDDMGHTIHFHRKSEIHTVRLDQSMSLSVGADPIIDRMRKLADLAKAHGKDSENYLFVTFALRAYAASDGFYDNIHQQTLTSAKDDVPRAETMLEAARKIQNQMETLSRSEHGIVQALAVTLLNSIAE